MAEQKVQGPDDLMGALGSAAEVDAELRHWISQAFEQAR
jgi:hypothetical protein